MPFNLSIKMSPATEITRQETNNNQVTSSFRNNNGIGKRDGLTEHSIYTAQHMEYQKRNWT